MVPLLSLLHLLGAEEEAVKSATAARVKLWTMNPKTVAEKCCFEDDSRVAHQVPIGRCRPASLLCGGVR